MEFEDSVQAAIETLPDDLREAMSNVAIVVEDEPPAGQPLLGLYEGIPLTPARATTPARRRTRSRSTAARSSGSTATTPSCCSGRSAA